VYYWLWRVNCDSVTWHVSRRSRLFSVCVCKICAKISSDGSHLFTEISYLASAAAVLRIWVFLIYLAALLKLVETSCFSFSFELCQTCLHVGMLFMNNEKSHSYLIISSANFDWLIFFFVAIMLLYGCLYKELWLEICKTACFDNYQLLRDLAEPGVTPAKLASYIQ